MTRQSKAKREDREAMREALTVEDRARYLNDPLGFVLAAFPWGQPDTELARSFGPTPYQLRILKRADRRVGSPRP
jgi:hypothetical protein